MKTMKKLLAVLLAVCFVLSVSVVAFADEDACAHSMTYWKVEREATVEHEGTMIKVCADCDDVIATEAFAQHTHTPGHLMTLIAPGCETVGESGTACAECGAVYETAEIPALGHTGNTSVSLTGGNIELVLLIDESGSMWGSDPNETRKDVAKNLVSKLGTSDKVAVVGFESYSRVITDFTADKDVINAAIDSVAESGGTDMYEGLETSFNLFGETTTATRYIVMLTDGQSSGYYDYATAASEKNVIIYTVGLGSGVNESELRSIAEATGGKYFFADVADDLFGIYEEITEEIITSGGTWVTTIVPTCSSSGERVCFCSRCGKAIGSETIAPAEHEYSAAVYVNEDCHTATCIDCGNTITAFHTWTEWVFNNDSTLFRNGTSTRYCTGCNRVETVTEKHTSIFCRIFYPGIKVILDLFNKMPINWIEEAGK